LLHSLCLDENDERKEGRMKDKGTKVKYNAAIDPNSVKWQVEHVLKSYTSCRSNDLLLYATVLHRYYGVDIADDRLLFDMEAARKGAYPSLETVIRTRRKFQARGWFTPKTKMEQFQKVKVRQKGHASIQAVTRFRRGNFTNSIKK
jgi:hypothetical protein